MSEGFSEHRCKKRYKPKRYNYPVVRILLFCVAVVLFVRLGFAEKVVQLLPGSTVVEASDWKSRCETMRGKAFELKNGLGQCSWVVSDSVFYLPNDFWRYIASQTNTKHPKLH